MTGVSRAPTHLGAAEVRQPGIALTTVLVAVVVCPVVALGLTSEGGFRYVVMAGVGVFAVGVLASGVARVREIALWLTLLACVLNFLPALLSPLNLDDQSLTQRILRDVALIPLFAMGLFGSRGIPQKSDSSLRLSAVFTAALWALALVMAVDLIVRGSDELSFVVSFRYLVLYPSVALVIWRLALSSAEINRVVLGIVWLGAFEAIVAILDFVGAIGNTRFDSTGDQLLGLDLGRAIGTLGNPNNLGLFLGLPAFLLIAGASPISRKTRILLLTLILVGIGTALSKTAPAAMVIALCLQRLLGQGRGGRWFPALGLAAVLAPLLYLVVSLRVDGAVSLASLLGSRVEAVPEGLRDVVSRTSVFLFGHGYGYGSQLSLGISTSFVADNMPLSVALEGGVLGLAIFTALVGAGIATVARAAREAPSSITQGLYGYCLFFLVYSIVAGNFRLFPGALLFWISVGLALTVLSTASARREIAQPAPAPSSVNAGPRAENHIADRS
jgi:hypothetical protein